MRTPVVSALITRPGSKDDSQRFSIGLSFVYPVRALRTDLQAVAIRGFKGEPPAHDAGIRNGVKYKERKTFLSCALLQFTL